MDSLLAWFTKFITSFSLERSQEDKLKFIVEESASVKLWLELRQLSSTMLLFMSTFAKDVDALKDYLNVSIINICQTITRTKNTKFFMDFFQHF